MPHDSPLDLAEHAIIGTIGCGGNLHAIAAFMQVTGLPPEYMYPGDPSTAAPDWRWHTIQQTVWDYLEPASMQEFKAVLLQYGPFVVGMNVFDDFWYYRDDVYSRVSRQLEGFHVMLLVGYDDARNCFKVKNSWDTTWGQAGFGLIDYSEYRRDGTDFGHGAHTYVSAQAHTRPPHPGHEGEVLVPPVIGLRPYTAETIITGAGLKCRLTGKYNSPNSRVYRQVPAFGKRVNKGSLVTLNCNTQPPQ